MTEGQPKETSILERLRAINPDKSIVLVAVERLHTQEEMAAFLTEYTEDVRTNSSNPMARRDPAAFAARSIYQATEPFGYAVLKSWHGLIHTGVVPQPDRLSTPARKKPGQNGGF